MPHVFKLSSAAQKANTIELSTKVCKVMPFISIVVALSGPKTNLASHLTGVPVKTFWSLFLASTSGSAYLKFKNRSGS